MKAEANTAPVSTPATLPPDASTPLADEATLRDVWNQLGIRIEGKQVAFATFVGKLTEFTTTYGPAKRSMPLIAPGFQALQAKLREADTAYTDRRFFACFDQTFIDPKWNGTYKNAEGKDRPNLHRHPAWDSYRNLLRWRAPKQRTEESLSPTKLAAKAAPLLRKMLDAKVQFNTFVQFMLLVGKTEATIYRFWNAAFPDRAQNVPEKKKAA